MCACRGRVPVPSPEVEKMIIDHSSQLGMERREISAEEIESRLLLPLVNEGFKVHACT